ncbi:hypothetical protein BJV38_003416 [Clostridium beijerinckii]|uniref:metallophosphoesterase n=1 Tax=Clostridium beijerinckii TaxID=1520 RepID=UPI00156F76A0|nr:metallophosphoesterase [Clostridium beijerinckii]NRT33997.1 hypothetical protein [Clostridium beijerinckii]NRT46573.1 hypothetical protein [Clostridium beijerinckii]NRZ19422.1 hypothetical protein [Clostridium beijerinckii]
MGVKIIQLSDIHIGKGLSDVNDLAVKIEMSLRNNIEGSVKVDAIVISGDIFDGMFFGADDYKEYISKAKIFFNKLITEFNNKHQTELMKENFIFLPGNHEIYRENARKHKDYFERYKEFLYEFYDCKIPDSYNLEYCSTFHKFEDEKVILIGFNSAHYEVKETDIIVDDIKESVEEDYGWISSSQLSDMTYQLDLIGNYNDYTIVAVLHHHFYLIEERNKEYIDNSTLRNHEQFLTYLNRFNLKVILHGHKHENTNRRLIVNSSLNEPDKIVTVIGSGSSNKKDVGYNSFNYIEIFSPEDCLDIKYNEFVYSSHSFQPNKEIILPLLEREKTSAKILDEFKKLGKIYNEYTVFRSIDTDSFTKELIETIDKTVGSIKGSAESIFKDPKIVFYLLIPIHYRCGIHKESCFISELECFCNNYLKDDFNIEIKKSLFYEILGTEDIMKIKPSYERLLSMASDREAKYLRFLMISIYMVEFHITLRLRAEFFYNRYIKYKSNISVNKGTLNLEIPGTNIEFRCDEERRAVGVYVKSKTANAHKVVSLIIKEFELLLKEYDDDFSKVGFNIYYTVPLITKMIQNGEIDVESYNFNAYIPTLIPLLAGESLYSEHEAFARELIQNSIDAIGIRMKKDERWANNGYIKIRMGEEEGTKYFEIEDNGAGMNRYIIERYFTCIGRSYYKSEDYEQLKIDYKPISMFGIGFLSCFIIGDRVDVYTKYFSSENNYMDNGLKLEIPNFDGCFFIENSDRIKSTGTIIRIYEDKRKKYFDNGKIINYIKENINNVPVNIDIDNFINDVKHVSINRFSYLEDIIKDTIKYKLLFFIPFDSGKVSYENIDINRFYNDQNYRSNYTNGIYIFKKDKDLYTRQNIFLNSAGIKVEGVGEFTRSLKKVIGYYFDIYINFTSDMVNLDVSRNEINKLELETVKAIAQVEEIFKAQTENYKKEREIQHLPYFVLREIDKVEYGYDKISLGIEENQFKIMFLSNSNDVQLNRFNVINKWLELNDIEALEINIQNYENINYDYNCKKNDLVIKCYNAILIMTLFQNEITAKEYPKYAKTIDISMDIPRNINISRIINMFRSMINDLDRHIFRFEDMSRFEEIPNDRIMDAAISIARDFEDNMISEIFIRNIDISYTRTMLKSIDKLLGYIYIHALRKYNHKKTNRHVNGIVLSTVILELSSAMLLTLEELNKGITIMDINEMIIKS